MTKTLYANLDPAIDAYVTDTVSRPAEPECCTLLERQTGTALDYGWAVAQLNKGASIPQMASAAWAELSADLLPGITTITATDIRGVLQAYGFVGDDEEGTSGPNWWLYKRAGFRRRG